MKRYYVSRHYIKWKGKLYRKGELLPETFTHHDKARNIYSSRIGVKDVDPEEPAFAATEPEMSASSVPSQAPTPPKALSGATTTPGAHAPTVKQFSFVPTPGTSK